MPRLMFEKTGNAVWISHLDLMRAFQRAFKRAGLPLTHTQGFNPRPSVSIALPLSVGIESRCEFLDFDLDGEILSHDYIRDHLNRALITGVHVLAVYDDYQKIKNIAFLDCTLRLEYDNGVIPSILSSIESLFCQEEVIVEKKSKNGISEQNIIPMIRDIRSVQNGEGLLEIHARICCQNPSLNPMQIPAAIAKYLPDCVPNHVTCCRNEIYDQQENIFR